METDESEHKHLNGSTILMTLSHNILCQIKDIYIRASMPFH